MSGNHTFDLYVRYHACPHCGKIIESRKDYEYRLDEYVKELECPRCKHAFTLKKSGDKRAGPLIGKPSPPEFDW